MSSITQSGEGINSLQEVPIVVPSSSGSGIENKNRREKAKDKYKGEKREKLVKEKEVEREEKVEYRLFYDKSISDYVIREVKPYLLVFDTFAKGRWLGRRLIDILSVEYGGLPIEYWQNAIRNGFVKVNDHVVTEEYIMRNSDRLYHKTHRHEPMVFGQIDFVGETDTLMAVNKPASIPMHPCGNYRLNSLEMILKHEPLVPNQPNLFLVHRLDRLTSGLIVLAKNKDTAAKVSEEIRKKTTDKIYLARVKGRFPQRLEQLKRWEVLDLAPYQEDYEKELEKEKWRNNPKNDNSAGAPTNGKSNKKRKFQGEGEAEEAQKQSEGGGGGGVGGEDKEQLPPGVVRRVQSFEEVIAAPLTGYVVAPVVDDSERNQRYRSLFPQADDREFWVSCPLDVISFREGIHACCSDGKPSLSRFRFLAYDSASDTSLVECKPYTGRTHQLRLHLWLLGNSIANDPCYGGELFYGNETRREIALQAMRVLEQNLHHRPLSKLPHIHQITTKEDELLLALQRNEERRVQMEELAEKEQLEKDGGRDFKVEPYPGESEDDFVVRTCKNCRENQDLVKLEHVVHCDGIWLHALCYAGKGWSFETAFPDWTAPFQQQHNQQHLLTTSKEEGVEEVSAVSPP